MTHGGGGRAMAQLIDELFLRAFDNEWLRQANDQAAFAVPAGRMVMATDSHVVSPLFFPGGDIGCLSVHGTINDVAMSGARPLYLAAGFVLEEGFPLADLKRIVESMAAAAREAGVPIVTGDTKVVERGKGDGVFITTTGVGVVPDGIDISGDRARPGDRILVSGTIGDHGVAIMSLRENLTFDTTIRSDTAALHGLVAAMVDAAPGIHCLRDPDPRRPRDDAERDRAPIGLRHGDRREATFRCSRRSPRRANCSASTRCTSPTKASSSRSCARDDAERLLAAMRAHPLGRDAAIVGEVDRRPAPFRADGHELRRPSHRRLADRRAAAADLLMRILLLAHSFNSLTQRFWVELTEARPRGLGRARRQRPRHGGSGRALAARPRRRAVPQAAHSRVRLAAPPLHRDPSGDPGRSRALGARLGDRRRSNGVGRHGAGGERATWTPATSGRRSAFRCATPRRAASIATRSPRPRSPCCG